ncbi:MAG TPA: hypothetical protein VLN45_00425 [Ignavibacteriaceae bacterium]|nr:hypothetical protein [Ignavibacteriaceae bacterium]
MNILELLGIVFLIVIILNVVIGVWAIKTALYGDKDVEVYSRN